MDRPSLHDDDLVTWAEEQAAASRARDARGELSNVLDWENVIEEIESVGRADFQGVESALSQMLVHILEYVSAPQAQPTRSARSEIVVFQAAAQLNYRPSMRPRIDWERLWRSAMRIADASLKICGGKLVRGLPERMPFTPEEMTAEGFDLDTALDRFATVLKSTADQH